jgi:RHS repeat-associated protein
MPSTSWARLAARCLSRSRTPRRVPLQLTPLEDRLVPAVFRWVNPAGGDLATAANWKDESGAAGVPGPVDDALILTSGITVTSVGTTTVRNLTSTADLDITGGTLTAAAANLRGSVDLAGGTLNLNGASTATTVSLSAGGLGGAGTLSIAGAMNWTGGTVGVDLHVLDNATLDIGGLGTDTLDDSILTNDGTVTWDGTGTLAFLHNAAVRNNRTFNDMADHAATFTGGAGESAVFHNRGQYTKSAGPGVTNIGVLFDNSGTIAADAGTLRLSGGALQIDPSGNLTAGIWSVAGGALVDVPGATILSNLASVTLTGTGSTFGPLTGLIENRGDLTLAAGAGLSNSAFFTNFGRVTIRPGSTLGVDGFQQKVGGQLTFAVGGRPASGQFGHLSVVNIATFDGGTLAVSVVPGADTQAGDVYTLFNAGNINNAVNAIEQGGAGTATVFNVAIGATAVTATAAVSVTDLAVSAVTLPAGTAAPGDPVTIGWTVTNTAAVASSVTGWSDAVYVSASPTFDASAVLVAEVPHNGALASGGSYNGTYTGPLPGIAPGACYLFVRVDAGQVVPEASRTNNLGVSVGTFAVTDAPTLTLGASAVNGTVAPGGDSWYRLDATGGTPLRITATFTTVGAGTMSVGYGTFPQPGSALDVAAVPTTLMQILGLSATQGGTYYVQVHGLTGGAFTIQADTPALAISRLVNATGSSAGSATLTIHGIGFTPDTKVSLVKGKTKRAATTVLYVDGDTVYATFKLKGLAAGSYDVQVVAGTQTVTAVGGYTVNTTPAGELVYHINPPVGTLWVGQDALVTIDVTNTGGTDVPTPVLEFFDANGANVRLAEEPGPGVGGVWFLPSSPDAPAGIIPAGYEGSVSIVVTPTVAGKPLDPVLRQVRDDTSMFWDVFFKEFLRPKGTPADSWSAVFPNFTATAGPTSATYMAALRSAATYLASVGTPVRNANVLLGYLIEQAGASIPGNTLVAATDASFPAPGLALDFNRTFPTSVGGQYRLGRLGRGWTDNWDIMLTSESGGAPPINGSHVFLRVRGTDREFAPVGGGSYAPVYGGEEDVLTREGTRFVLTAHDGTVTAFRTDGQLDYLQDPGGTRITASYDGTSHLTSLTHSSGRALTFTWTAAGQIATVTDPAGRVTTLAYAGQQMTSALGAIGIEKYTYQKNALASVTTPGGVKTTFTYDKRHRLTGRKVGKTQAITYSYGVGGSVTATDAVGGKATLLADARGQIAVIRRGVGSDLRMTYDDNGQSTRVETSGGQVWTTIRDDEGHPAAVTDPLGHTVRYAFQGDDLAGITDARGNTTSYQVDPAGNALSLTHPGGATEAFVYDPTGSLVETINGRGNAVQYLTNADGQVVHRLFADGSSTNYTYDTYGSLTSATDASGSTTLAYLANGLLDKITYPDTQFLQFTYDAGGRRSTSVDKDGFTMQYVYGQAGRLAQLVDDTGKALVKYTYDKAGRVTRKDDANGTFATYAYDAAGRLLTLVNHKDKKTINAQFDYTYDPAGRVGSMKTDGVTTTYDYDAAGQLVAATTPADSISYTYDAAGNRTSSTDNGVTTNYTVNSRNEVTVAGATTYGYDADGNRTSMTDASGTSTYTWNDINRLTGVTAPTDTFTYTDDGLDQLFATTRNGQTTTNLTDPFGLGTVTAHHEGSNLIAHYVNGLGLEARVAADGSRAFYDFDRLGNVVGLTSAAGTYVNRYNYSPFGEATTVQASLGNSFTFVGRWGVSSDGNGLFNMRARSYDAATGGFVSDDPLGFAGGDDNIRRYAGNDPVSRIDPTGLKCEDELEHLEAELALAKETLEDNDPMSELFLHSPLWRVMVLAGNPALYAAELSRITPADIDLIKAKLEGAKKALDECKKKQAMTAYQPPETFTTPSGKDHKVGGIGTKPAKTQ